MRREGLVVDSQTLYDQIEALARVLWPAYDRLGAELLDEPVIFVDETPWPLLGKGAETARWHVWAVASPKGAYYEIHDTRGLEAGKSLLAGFKGIGITDGYGVYDALEKSVVRTATRAVLGTLFAASSLIANPRFQRRPRRSSR